mgnify:FL=1
MIYTTEVQHMCPVAKGAYHGPAPIPEEGKWVQAKEISDISGFTHGVGWCAPQQGACKLSLNIKDGVIEEVYASDLLCGGKIVIKHDNDVRTVYEYVEAAANLKAGDTVTRGQAIGTVAAATGAEYKDGAHLHFEVIEKGESVDPSSYLTLEEK